MSRGSLEAAARLFNELAAAQDAATWQRLHPAIEATTALLDYAMTAWKTPLQAEFISEQQLLPSAWCAAAAAGLRLVVAKTVGVPSAVPLPRLALQAIGLVVAGLSQLLYHFHGRMVAGGGVQGGVAALGMVQHFAAAGGVYQALCGACPALSALLDKSPGTTLQAAGCVELLSFAVLQLWRSCARISPGPIIVGSAGSTVAPIVQLSEAVLRRWPGTGPVAAGNSSSRMRRRESATRAAAGVHLDGRELLRDAANEVMCLTDKLAFCLFDEVLTPNNQWHNRTVQQLVKSASMHRLMITNLACTAQRQHSFMRGKSPVPPEPLAYLGISTSSSSSSSKASSSKSSSSKSSSSKGSSSKGSSSKASSRQQQPMAIPTHHEAMLIALGLQGLDHLELSARTTAGDEHNSVAVAVAAVHLITVKRRDASVRLAASSSAEPQESQDLVVPGLTDTGLALPLARLLVEALLLAPADVELCGGALRMLLLALQAHHAVTTAESGRYAADAELLRDVLLLAAPSVLHTLAEARASGAADILTASDAEKAEHMDSLATLVMRLTMSGDEECLVAPFLQQPGLVGPLLEAVLRRLAAPQQQQQLAAQPTLWPEAAAAYDPHPMAWAFTKQLVRLLQGLTSSGQQQQCTAALSLLNADKRSAVLQQLQSLALALAKTLASSSTRYAPDDCVLRVGFVLAACLELPRRVAAANSSSSAAGSSSAAATAAAAASSDGYDPWQGWEQGSDFAAVAAARILLLTSRLVRLSLGDDSNLLGSVSMGLPSLHVAAGGLVSVMWLAQALAQCNHALLALAKSQVLAAADGGAAAAQQSDQLADDVMDVVEELEGSCYDVVDEAAAGASDAASSYAVTSIAAAGSEDAGPLTPAFIQQVLELLHRVEAAACSAAAALPCRQLCNNVACLNLAKLSEGQLVSGKGCVCSRCKTARYCSRGCQEQHYKDHRRICKALQQKQQQQQAK